MRTVLQFHDHTATIMDGDVSTPNEITERLLMSLYLSLDGYIPDDDYEVALQFTRRYGGKIIEYDGPPGEGNTEGTVY